MNSGIIDVSSFRANELAGVSFDCEFVAPDYFGVDGSVKAKFDGELSFDGETFTLGGTLKARYKASCARCLEPIETELGFKVYERFVRTGTGRGEDNVIEGDTLNLNDVVFAVVISEMPRKTLCADDCAGISINR